MLTILDETYITQSARQLGLVGAKPVTTPGLTIQEGRSKYEHVDDTNDWTVEEIAVYKSGVGRLLYLSHIRIDMQSASVL